MRDPEIEECLLEIAKIRPTLTPQYQILLDKAQALWLEMDEQALSHPSDGHAVMTQAALSLLFQCLSVHPQSLCVVVATSMMMEAIKQISKAKSIPELTNPLGIKEEANVPSHKTLQ